MVLVRVLQNCTHPRVVFEFKQQASAAQVQHEATLVGGLTVHIKNLQSTFLFFCHMHDGSKVNWFLGTGRYAR